MSVPLETSQRDKREKVSGGKAPITKSAFLADAVMALRRNRASTRRNQGAASAGVKAGRVTFGVAAAVAERSPAGLEPSEVLASTGMVRGESSELKGHQCREVRRQVLSDTHEGRFQTDLLMTRRSAYIQTCGR